MFCSNCGTRNDDNALFCAECGNSLRNAAQNAAQDNVYAQPEVQQAVYQQPAASAAGGNSFMSYPLPENPIIKLPFPSFVLKFIKLGIWSFYFFAIFFGWIFVKASGWGYNQTESRNLFQVVFAGGETFDGVSGGAILVIFGILVLLTILGVIALQVLNMFLPDKLPGFLSSIPQIVLCAAPAAVSFLFMILAWIIMGTATSQMSGWGINVSAGPGFGAWFVFILSGIETAAFILFMKGKDESLFKA